MPIVDINKITLENINDFIINPKQNTKKGISKNLNKKEYQHQYYLKVTKLKRKLKKDEFDNNDKYKQIN